MKKLLSRVVTCIMLFCMISFQVQPVFAATVENTVPTVAQVQQESIATADYLLNTMNFTDIAETGKFFNTSKTLVLAMRSGADSTVYVNQYLAKVESILNNDGSLNLSVTGNPQDVAGCYATLIMVLTLDNKNPADFNHINIVKYFDTLLNTYQLSDYQFTYNPITYESTGMNPYMLGLVYQTVLSYEDKLTNATHKTNLINQAVKNMSNDTGIDYYGNSTDNNGLIYPLIKPMTVKDNEINTLVSSIYSMEAANLDHTDGISANWGTKNSDSTAAALALFSIYGKTDEAAISYHALVNNFKVTATPGAYSYTSGGTANLLSTQDSLYGLVSYLNTLKNTVNPFDVSDKLLESNTPSVPEKEPATKPTDQPQNNPVIEPSTGDVTNTTDHTNGEVITTPSENTDETPSAIKGDSDVPTSDNNVLMSYGLLIILSSLTMLSLANRKRRHQN